MIKIIAKDIEIFVTQSVKNGHFRFRFTEINDPDQLIVNANGYLAWAILNRPRIDDSFKDLLALIQMLHSCDRFEDAISLSHDVDDAISECLENNKDFITNRNIVFELFVSKIDILIDLDDIEELQSTINRLTLLVLKHKGAKKPAINTVLADKFSTIISKLTDNNQFGLARAIDKILYLSNRNTLYIEAYNTIYIKAILNLKTLYLKADLVSELFQTCTSDDEKIMYFDEINSYISDINPEHSELICLVWAWVKDCVARLSDKTKVNKYLTNAFVSFSKSKRFDIAYEILYELLETQTSENPDLLLLIAEILYWKKDILSTRIYLTKAMDLFKSRFIKLNDLYRLRKKEDAALSVLHELRQAISVIKTDLVLISKIIQNVQNGLSFFHDIDDEGEEGNGDVILAGGPPNKTL